MKRLILLVGFALAPCRAGEIHDAVRHRDLAAVEQLLKKNPRLIESHTFPDYRAPLHHAIGAGDAAMVKHLLAAGANVNAPDATGATAVLRAAVISDDDSCDRLIGEVTSWLKGATSLDTVCDPKGALAAIPGTITATDKASRLEILAAILSSKRALNLDFSGLPLLHWAVLGGNAGAAKLVLDTGAEVNAKALEAMTPLHFAARRGNDRAMVELLLSRGARTEVFDKEGRTPLMLAANAGAIPVVEALLAGGATIDAEDNGSQPVIGYAALGGHEDLVTLLYEKGGRDLIRYAKHERLFQAAAAGGSQRMVDILLAAGVDVNLQDESGYTPLLSAIEHQREAVAQHLIEKGADRAARTKDGAGIFKMACIAGNTALVKELLAGGASVDDASFLTAVQSGRPELVELFLSRGSDANLTPPGDHSVLIMAMVARSFYLARQSSGQMFLSVATEDDYAQIVELLLARGAKVNAKARDGESAILFATLHAGPRAVKALLKAGVNPKEKAGGGYVTLLHAAAEGANGETAGALIAAGADVRAINDRGETQTPLHRAALNGNAGVMRVLLANGAQVNARTPKEKATPLHFAANQNSSDCVRLLLEAGALPNERDANLAPPLYATRIPMPPDEFFRSLLGTNSDPRAAMKLRDLRSRLEVARLLLQYGAATDRKMLLPGIPGPVSFIEAVEKSGAPQMAELLRNPPPAIKQARGH